MATIGVRELREETSTILRRVQEQGETLDVTDEGRVIARIVPVEPTGTVRPGLLADLDAIDEFAAEVSAAWKDNMSAADAVKEQRREL